MGWFSLKGNSEMEVSRFQRYQQQLSGKLPESFYDISFWISGEFLP